MINGSIARSRLRGRKALHLYQVEDEEEYCTQRAIQQERQQVRAAERLCSRNSPSGIIGAAERASTITNPTSAAAPPTIVPITRASPQPRLLASIGPITSPPNPTVASQGSQPVELPCASSLLFSGTRVNKTSSTITASGTLMKNTHRQDTFSTSQPPNSGPIAAVIDVAPDHVPIALPRSPGAMTALIIDRLRNQERTAHSLK